MAGDRRSSAFSWFEVQGFRPDGRVTFLCWHKEKSPKESAYGSQKRVGRFNGANIFRLAIHGSVGKRRASMHAALRVGVLCRVPVLLKATAMQCATNSNPASDTPSTAATPGRSAGSAGR